MRLPASYRFGAFELDRSLLALRRDGVEVAMQPRVFQVLVYLIEHRDRVVPGEELLATVWKGAISPTVLTRCIKEIRKALGDPADDPRAIQTLRGRGYRFVAAVTETGPTQRAPAWAPPSVVRKQSAASSCLGRAEPLARLAAGWDDALRGRGRVVAITGEPGIGKSTLASVAAERAGAEGGIVLRGRCSDREGTPELWPWHQVLRAAAAEAALGARATELRALCSDLEAPRVREAAESLAEARFRATEAIGEALLRVADVAPLFIFIEDVQWADASTAALCVELARATRTARLFVVATARTPEPNSPCAGALLELAGEPGFEHLALGGLSRGEIGQLVERVRGTHSAALVERVHAVSGGNPFFAQEILRLAARDVDGLADAESVALPPVAREAIAGRLARLPEGDREVLRVAAVMGVTFSVTDVAEVMGVPVSQVLRALDRPAIEGIVTEDEAGTGRHRFAHALFQETFYANTPLSTRSAWHGRIAARLETHGADAGEIAFHWLRTKTRDASVHAAAACRRAAALAMQRFDYEHAIRHARAALEHLRGGGDARARAEVGLELGEAELRGATLAEARVTFRDVVAAARSLDDERLFARAVVGFAGGSHLVISPPADAELAALLDEAAERLGEDEPLLRAQVLVRMTVTPPFCESLPRRDALSRQACALAERAGDTATLCHALVARFWVQSGPDDGEARLATAERVATLANDSRDPSVEIVARELRASARLALGDAAGADADLDAMAALAERHRVPAKRWATMYKRASRALCRGDFAEAERLAREAETLGARIGHPTAHVVAASQLAWSRVLSGTPDPPPADIAGRAVPGAEPLVQAAFACGAAEAGDRATALAALAALPAERLRTLRRDEHWLLALGFAALAAAAVEDTRQAQVIYDLLAPYGAIPLYHHPLRLHLGSAAHVLGVLLACLGRKGEARVRLEQALAANRALGARPYAVRTALELARLLAADDPAAARRYARAAHAEATALGMIRVAERARALGA